MSQKVVTFGEIMMRLSTEKHLRFSQAHTFEVNYGGGEFNVAASLSNFGIATEFVTRLPDNDLGQTALMHIRKHDVASGHCVLGGSRLGLYFLETGAGLRGSKVVYDRSRSAIAEIEVGMIDWEQVFQDAAVFHWSGITPAISQNAAEVCLEAVKKASDMGVLITTDLNYRSKLWQYGKSPHEIMPQLLSYSNLILGDLDTAFMMLGQKKIQPDYKNSAALPQLYDKLFQGLPNLKYITTSLRYAINASHQQIGGVWYDGNTLITSPVRDVAHVVDRVGSGDAFMAGIIYGLLRQEDNPQYIIDFAVAACCLKHTIAGDVNWATRQEVEALMQGSGSGVVSR